ncbi:hypothetical protein [Mucilaginibacter paludis]|uniref:Uncharacterized protein n=1 Tax=Mucilaginibacter paludis DSM 18603 TaxID=714943 RepID=H1Y6Z0_9SPHI|nr:hypothetical protein [Mucilaginibacter paludis]EHQ28397.1 hypothetical protein Mucpa_4307 [Mucilaginibacter paludis DSM 18603]
MIQLTIDAGLLSRLNIFLNGTNPLDGFVVTLNRLANWEIIFERERKDEFLATLLRLVEAMNQNQPPAVTRANFLPLADSIAQQIDNQTNESI